MDGLVFEAQHSLIRQSLQARQSVVTTNGDGFGVGWYGERPEPGVYRDILPAWNDPNLRNLAHQVRSGLFFAHVRASTGTATSRGNCHPFSCGPWLFMHNGQIGGYARVRRRLESEIDEDHYGHRLGTTDSELMFLMLFAQGLEGDPCGAVARTLGRVRTAMRAAAIEEPLRVTAALSDGRRMLAVRYASDERPPSLYWRADGGSLVVVSEPLDEGKGDWHAVPPGHVVLADGPVTPQVLPLAMAD
jgi:glutamine amidotransferase